MSTDVRTSGIVVTLAGDDAARQALLERLSADPRVGTAPITGGVRLPLSFEATTHREEREFWASLEDDPAVAFVNLVFHHSDAGDEPRDDEEVRRDAVQA